MSVAALLDRLRERGVELRGEDGQLHYSAPKGALTAELRSALAEHKVELLEILQGVQLPAAPSETAYQPAFRPGQAAPIDPSEFEGGHSYARYVNPYLSAWLARLDLDKEFTRGEGCYLFDAQGVRYLDCIAQFGALPFGYNPPEIWAALDQARHSQLPSFVQPSMLATAGALAERLVQLAPPGLRYVTYTNSGAEAIEAAIKLCRAATGRRGILAANQGYHGKTLGALAATGSAHYQEPFGAPVDGFHHIPFGDVRALSAALSSRRGYYAAVILEPIQGEGGIIEAPPGYLHEVQALCRKHGTLLVLDEVQTGLGRTGELFACTRENVVPDVLVLAKALGGGLIPIGACLSTGDVYTEEFAIQHSSTFAGNALACQVGLASLDLLEADNRRIIRDVAKHGQGLKEGLLDLQERYPDIIKAVRGTGYLLGVELDLDSPALQGGLFGYLADGKLLTYLVSSYLLNVEKIRVAPTASAEGVLRIEPPLIAGWDHCQAFLAGFSRTLDVLARGDTARLIGHLVGAPDATGSTVSERHTAPRRIHKRTHEMRDDATVGRFAFLVHLTELADFVDLDPTLSVLTEEQLMLLRERGAGLLSSAPISEILIESRTGQRAYGEFIAVPYTARELIEMPRDAALTEIGRSVEVAIARGAQIVGLGGFTSVVTLGGLALRDLGLGPLTTGNSYTVASAIRALRMACDQVDRRVAASSVAVMGATGAIGRATSLLISEDAASLILIGNPAHPDRATARLRHVAAEIVQHLWELHTRQPRQFAPGTLGASLLAHFDQLPASPTPSAFAQLAREVTEHSGRLTITTDLGAWLPQADIVITATSAVEGVLEAAWFKRDAILCEISRPFNATPEVRAARPDLRVIEGGLIRTPSEPDGGWGIGHRPGMVFACMAETMLLALERRNQDASLGQNLDLRHIRELDILADKHGFEVESGWDGLSAP